MPNFPRILRVFLQSQGQAGSWPVTDALGADISNPRFDKIQWPYRISRDWMLNDARRGQSFIWIKKRTVTPRAETDWVQTAWETVEVYCMTRSLDNNEDHVRDAQERSENMREAVKHLVKLNAKTLAPAWNARSAEGERELEEPNLDPYLIVQILPITFWFAEM